MPRSPSSSPRRRRDDSRSRRERDSHRGRLDRRDDDRRRDRDRDRDRGRDRDRDRSGSHRRRRVSSDSDDSVDRRSRRADRSREKRRRSLGSSSDGSDRRERPVRKREPSSSESEASESPKRSPPRAERSRDRDSGRRRKSASPQRSRERETTRDRPGPPPPQIKREIKEEGELIPWGGMPKPKLTGGNADEPVKEKEQPSLVPSGKLLEDTNAVNGVVVKYTEPPEAKLPKAQWQLHPFRNHEGKDPEPLPIMHIHRRSCYLIGRDRKVVQFPMDHPSCSKQHAALQYRSLPYTRADGEPGRRTLPYIIDLGSSNGTFLNDDRIEPLRYYELKHGDEVKFGFSSRSFIILNASAAIAAMEEQDDDPIKKEDLSEDEEPIDIKPAKKPKLEAGGDRFEL